MDVHVTMLSVDSVIELLVKTFEPVAKQKNLTFAVEIDSSWQRPKIETGRQRVQQILRNLLSNAFKFTEKGRVSLQITGDDQSLSFLVSDTGIGIAAHQQGGIFEAFRQADGTTNRKYDGTGLGLSISRDLARLLGGSLSVQSEPG